MAHSICLKNINEKNNLQNSNILDSDVRSVSIVVLHLPSFLSLGDPLYGTGCLVDLWTP